MRSKSASRYFLIPSKYQYCYYCATYRVPGRAPPARAHAKWSLRLGPHLAGLAAPDLAGLAPAGLAPAALALATPRLTPGQRALRVATPHVVAAPHLLITKR